ncbi:hypothetical protein Taro_039503 [Colocasia esculenta]|uniref:Uncharacterized protein n=1 Tax=Colocasia esculenta TaxID=4460 RepID=A0A843WME4_COLES|nr:hypothetical protein [Colocasia esculenta]
MELITTVVPKQGCSCCYAACVASVVARHVRAVAARLALDSLEVAFLVWRTLASQSRCLCAVVRCARDVELSRCLMCCVAPLVERCNTCLWLLPAWCWQVVSFGVVLPKFFSVGSGGSEDCFVLVSAVVVRPQSLRCAVGLAGAFWRVFPRTVPWWFWWRFSQDRLVLLLQFYLLQCSSLMDRPLSLLAEVIPRSASCSFRATVELPLDELSVLPVGMSVLQSAWAFPVKVLAMHLAAMLANLSC